MEFQVSDTESEGAYPKGVFLYQLPATEKMVVEGTLQHLPGTISSQTRVLLSKGKADEYHDHPLLS